MVIVPVQYILSVDSRCRKESIHFATHALAELTSADSFRKWLFDQLDYSRGFKGRVDNRAFEFADLRVQERFEEEFWPLHLRSDSSGFIASPVNTGARQITNGLWRIRTDVSFFSVQGVEADASDSIIFEVDVKSSPPKILDFKHEHARGYCAEFLKSTNDSGCSRFSEEAVAHFKNGVSRKFFCKGHDSMREFSKALELEPQFANAAIMMAKESVFSTNPENGERIITKAISLLPNRVSLFRARASLRLEQGKIEEALADMNYAIEHERTSGYSYINRGYCYSQLGMHKEALADMESAFKFVPDKNSVYIFRAHAREASGDSIGAFFDFVEVKQRCKDYFFDEKNRPLAVPYVSFSP